MKGNIKNFHKKAISVILVFIIGIIFYLPHIAFLSINAAQITPISDTLSMSGSNPDPDKDNATNVAHLIQFTATSIVPVGKDFILYMQCDSTTPINAFNAITAGSLLIKDGNTTIFSGAASVSACTAANVASFPNTSFVAVTSGAITSQVNISDSVTISGITATNPAIDATIQNPYVFDLQDTNVPPDEGYLALPITSSNQVTVTGVVTPYLTLGLTGSSVDYGNFTTGVNTAGTTTVISTSTNATQGVNIYIWDNGKPADSTGAVGGLWSNTANHKIAATSNVAKTTITSSSEAFGVNGGTGTLGLNVQSPYNDANPTTVGGYLKQTTTLFASSSGPINLATASLAWITGILPITPAGVYSDTITFTAVGAF